MDERIGESPRLIRRTNMRLRMNMQRLTQQITCSATESMSALIATEIPQAASVTVETRHRWIRL
jgi:hypothetical protein